MGMPEHDIRLCESLRPGDQTETGTSRSHVWPRGPAVNRHRGRVMDSLTGVASGVPIYLSWLGESLFHLRKNLIKIARAEHMLNFDTFP